MISVTVSHANISIERSGSLTSRSLYFHTFYHLRIFMPITPEPQQNHLLAAISEVIQDRLYPFLKVVFLPLGKVLYESGDVMQYVYFPTNSIVSLIYVMKDGASTEISVVGNDGMVGVSLFMGGESTPSRAVVQSAGYAYQIKSQDFKHEFSRHGEIMTLMLSYAQSLITQMTQTAACNRHHSIDQQLCRWLLLSLDRLMDNDLCMTQELIANMLGVRREGVTEAAGKLQKLGVIKYARGHIKVLDRKKLETLSCECYAVVKKETDRLLPTSHTCPANSHANSLATDAARKKLLTTRRPFIAKDKYSTE
jgi:CRP-like cAMP-binding protein